MGSMTGVLVIFRSTIPPYIKRESKEDSSSNVVEE